MLVLRARDNQVIIIRNQNTGQQLELFAVRDGNKIKLCFDAPKCFRIVRQEVVKRDEAKAKVAEESAKAEREAANCGTDQPTEESRSGEAEGRDEKREKTESTAG